VLQPVAHILLQVRESVGELVDGLTEAQWNARPAGVASAAFHVRHMTGVIDRLFTYARGQALSAEQFAAMKLEGSPLAAADVSHVLDALSQRVDAALSELKSLDPATLGDFRGVGRAQLPSTVIGCLTHGAEHAMRHVGQLSVTVRVVRSAKPAAFVPKDFVVPAVLETPEFRLRMLTVNDVVKDYDAVMSSVEHLRDIWPGSGWPDGLTFEQDLIDLGWHQKEFQTRRSFAYTVVSLDESEVLGCVYVDPTRKLGYDAVVYLWARQSALASGLETRLHAAVKTWLAESWPFKSVAFPGREIEWDVWRSLPEGS